MEEVRFVGSIETKNHGDVLSRMDLDGSGAYPKATRKMVHLASTAEVTIGLANIASAMIVGIEAETGFALKFGAADTAVTCRGVWVGQVRGAQLKIAPSVATAQDIYIYAGGI